MEKNRWNLRNKSFLSELIDRKNVINSNRKSLQISANMKLYERELKEKQQKTNFYNDQNGFHDQHTLKRRARIHHDVCENIDQKKNEKILQSRSLNRIENFNTKSRKGKQILEISDRSMTPTNFHYYNSIGEQLVEKLSRKKKKKSVSFLEKPVTFVNEKKKRRLLIPKSSTQKIRLKSFKELKVKKESKRRKLKVDDKNKQEKSCRSLSSKSRKNGRSESLSGKNNSKKSIK